MLDGRQREEGVEIQNWPNSRWRACLLDGGGPRKLSWPRSRLLHYPTTSQHVCHVRPSLSTHPMSSWENLAWCSWLLGSTLLSAKDRQLGFRRFEFSIRGM